MANRSNPPEQAEGNIAEDFFVGICRGIAGHLFDKATKFHSVQYIRRHAQPGDLLEFQRGFYSHYAINLGNGRVLNIDAEDKNHTEARIRERTLEDVCGDSKVRVSNHEDIALKHFNVVAKPVAQIIMDAKSYENKMVPYKFDFTNCEYYCTLWRYGIGFSTQTAKPTQTPAGMFLQEVGNSSQPIRSLYGAAQVVLDNDEYSKYKRLANRNK